MYSRGSKGGISVFALDIALHAKKKDATGTRASARVHSRVIDCELPLTKRTQEFHENPDHALEWGGGGYISLNEMSLVSSHPAA